MLLPPLLCFILFFSYLFFSFIILCPSSFFFHVHSKFILIFPNVSTDFLFFYYYLLFFLFLLLLLNLLTSSCYNYNNNYYYYYPLSLLFFTLLLVPQPSRYPQAATQHRSPKLVPLAPLQHDPGLYPSTASTPAAI